jgi:CspA family cold shock protein
MKTGTVKWFNGRKGYGFLKPVDGGFDVYVHISAVERAGLVDLKEGQKISFDLASDDRTGEVFAENLRLLFDAPSRNEGESQVERPPASSPFTALWAGRRLS